MDERTIYHNMLEKHQQHIDHLNGKFTDLIPELTDNMAARIAALEADRARLVALAQDVAQSPIDYPELIRMRVENLKLRAAALLAGLTEDTDGSSEIDLTVLAPLEAVEVPFAHNPTAQRIVALEADRARLVAIVREVSTMIQEKPKQQRNYWFSNWQIADKAWRLQQAAAALLAELAESEAE